MIFSAIAKDNNEFWIYLLFLKLGKGMKERVVSKQMER